MAKRSDNPAAALARMRAASLTPERRREIAKKASDAAAKARKAMPKSKRSEIARKAAEARWGRRRRNEPAVGDCWLRTRGGGGRLGFVRRARVSASCVVSGSIVRWKDSEYHATARRPERSLLLRRLPYAGFNQRRTHTCLHKRCCPPVRCTPPPGSVRPDVERRVQNGFTR